MATIPRAALDYLTKQINGISAEAQSKVLRVLQQISWTPENIAQCRDVVLEALALVMPTYTDMAAQASADFYDESRRICIGQRLGAIAESGYDPVKTDGAVRAFVQHIVDGKHIEQFNDQVLQRIDYELKRSAGNSIVQNGMRDPVKPRFARVPTGAETCEFCLMLASRGFVYHSEKSAGGLTHWHSHCDCRVVAGWDGIEVEGYDPDAYLEMWRKIQEMRDGGAPITQRQAVTAAMRDRLMPGRGPDPSELSGLYQRGMSSAWSEFKARGKTRGSYEATVGAFLSDMGDAAGCDFSAEFMARPDGDELWAASKLASKHESIMFRYADYSSKNPDYLLDGSMAEVKTPSSRRKVTNRLVSISEQFEPYPEERKVGIVSAIHLDSDADYIIEVAQRFVDDGTLDEVIVIRASGDLVHVS